MKSNVKNYQRNNDVVIQGRGGLYSAVSNESLDTLDRWMTYSDITSSELKRVLMRPPYKIQENTLLNGNKEVTIYSTHSEDRLLTQVGAPFVWECSGTMDFEEFCVTLSLVLLAMAAQYGDEAFRQTVERYARKYAK